MESSDSEDDNKKRINSNLSQSSVTRRDIFKIIKTDESSVLEN